MPNRLSDASSPYLLQHRDNPVDWYPWGEEAFQKAKEEGKPIFLSVGYSSCHWCHVMAHESFEDETVAELLNQHFISVKVDREERPDVDEAYMTAVQLSSGRGGWPMSVFLTPDRKPFFAGTYFPKEDRGGSPGFKSILAQLAAAWRGKRTELQKAADAFAVQLREAISARAPGTFETITPDLFSNAVRKAASEFDPKHGGSKGAPKFPPHTAIEFLISYALSENADPELQESALGMALMTLEQMSLGGIHDQVGGGFHRYSTDEKWLLPHFEKMLYDNALMLGNLARGSAIAAQVDAGLQELFSRTAANLLGWLHREMTSTDGLFYAAIDADSEGEEGKFYVWTEADVKAVLGSQSDEFASSYGFQSNGNFADEATGRQSGANIPHLSSRETRPLEIEIRALLAARGTRVRPETDTKALVGWNGLMIDALASVGAIEHAEKAASAILEAETSFGQLPHQISGGQPSGIAFLEDYAYFIHALLGIAAAREYLDASSDAPSSSRSPTYWAAEARRLADDMVAKFYDDEHGGFFSTSHSHEELFGRSKPAFDQPVPSGNAIAIRCLIELGNLTRAKKSLDALMGWMLKVPLATEALYTAALEYTAAAALMEGVEEPAALAPIAEPASPPTANVRVSLKEAELRADGGGRAHGVVILDVPTGLHLNSHDPPARWLTPTLLTGQPLKIEADYPPAPDDRYEGLVKIPFQVKLNPSDKGSELEITVSYQACTDSECLLPSEHRLSASVVR